MANVFVFCVHDEEARVEFEAAALRGYGLEDVLKSVRDDFQAESLRRYYPGGRCYAWGVTDRGGNRSTWEFMAENDLVLAFYRGSIIAAAYVCLTMDEPRVAEAMWGEGTSNLIWFSEKPYSGDVPVITQMDRYLDHDFTGFTRLDPVKCENILSDYGSFETFVRLCLKYDFPFSFRHSE